MIDIESLAKEGYLRAAPRAHGGIHYERVKDAVIDFSTNVNPLGASKNVYRAIRQNLSLITSYPDPNTKIFTKAVSEYLDIDKEYIVTGNGSNEIIHLFADVFIGKGEDVIIPVPTFFEYEFACDRNSASINFLEMQRLDPKIVIESMKGAKALFICNPNNPTGLLADHKAIEQIVDKAYDNNVLVMIDECFMEFTEEPEKHSFVKRVNEYDNLLILRSLTKAFGLAGLRAGYCIASKNIASILKRVKVQWSVNALAEVAAAEALRDLEHIEKTKRLVRRERAYLEKEIGKIDTLELYKSDVNFFLVRIKKGDSISLKSKLLEHGILVRDCSTFTGMGTDHIRISVRKREDNSRLVKALGEIC